MSVTSLQDRDTRLGGVEAALSSEQAKAPSASTGTVLCPDKHSSSPNTKGSSTDTPWGGKHIGVGGVEPWAGLRLGSNTVMEVGQPTSCTAQAQKPYWLGNYITSII